MKWQIWDWGMVASEAVAPGMGRRCAVAGWAHGRNKVKVALDPKGKICYNVRLTS